MTRLVSTLVTLALVLFVLALSTFAVDQRQFAIVLELGKIERVVKTPGLQFKLPFIQNVRLIDNRIQTMDEDTPDLFNTIEKKNVLVDSYVKWQVADAEQYYKSVGGDERVAEARLRNTVNDVLRQEFGRRTVDEVIWAKRDEVMDRVLQVVDTDARAIGLRVIDVRLKRVDFPPDISNAVYERMNSERKTVANQLRAEGAGEAQRIRADADRQKEIILADAYGKAQTLQGEGDARASAIYGAAYGANPEFYAFYRSLESYKQSFKSKNDVVVVDPSATYFKYLKDPKALSK